MVLFTSCFLCLLFTFGLWVYNFHSLEIFCPSFPQTLLPLPFRDSNNIYIRPLSCPTVHWFCFSVFFFPCFTLYTSYCYVFNSLIFSFTMSNLSLILSSVFFISVIIVFVSRSSSWIFYFIFMFSMSLYFKHMEYSYNDVLMRSSSNSNIYVSSELISIN